jgi:1,4-dihydroxy-2-naphthoate octaprenyltransferase
MAPPDFMSAEQSNGISRFLYYSGFRYWTASLLPALVGTMLPFWLRPSGFSFKWLAAIEFLIATIFFHAGFSFLLAWVQNKVTPSWNKTRLIKYACICIGIACFLGVHLNDNLILQTGVPKYIFMVYGLTTLFVGVLYVLPPFTFYQRVGGEIILAEGFGMIPLLGAYLIQVGDLTRTVYLASLPLIVATGLWVWMDELASRIDDEKIGRKTGVIEFGCHFSGRYGVSALSFLLILTILLPIFSGSVNSVTLISFLLVGLLWKIVTVSRNEYSFPERMIEIRKYAFIVHLAIGSIFALSSLVTILINNG